MPEILDLRKKVRKESVQSPVKKEVVLAKNKSDEIAWQISSFGHAAHKKYITGLVITLFCGAVAVIFFQKDILMGIFLALASLVLILNAGKKPSAPRIVVNKTGINIDDQKYYYRELKSFWLDYDPKGSKELSLEAKKWYMPYIRVSIENQNPLEIRSLVVSFLPEKEHERSLIDLISRKLGL